MLNVLDLLHTRIIQFLMFPTKRPKKNAPQAAPGRLSLQFPILRPCLAQILENVKLCPGRLSHKFLTALWKIMNNFFCHLFFPEFFLKKNWWAHAEVSSRIVVVAVARGKPQAAEIGAKVRAGTSAAWHGLIAYGAAQTAGSRKITQDKKKK